MSGAYRGTSGSDRAMFVFGHGWGRAFKERWAPVGASASRNLARSRLGPALEAARGARSGAPRKRRGLALTSYLSSTLPPASSSSALSLSASSRSTPSLTGLGASSTSALASLRPRPVAARTTLMTWIFLSPAAGEDDVDGARLLLLGARRRRRRAAAGRGGGDGGRRDAELLLERLDALAELEHGDALELLDPIAVLVAMVTPNPPGCQWCQSCVVGLSGRLVSGLSGRLLGGLGGRSRPRRAPPRRLSCGSSAAGSSARLGGGASASSAAAALGRAWAAGRPARPAARPPGSRRSPSSRRSGRAGSRGRRSARSAPRTRPVIGEARGRRAGRTARRARGAGRSRGSARHRPPRPPISPPLNSSRSVSRRKPCSALAARAASPCTKVSAVGPSSSAFRLSAPACVGRALGERVLDDAEDRVGLAQARAQVGRLRHGDAAVVDGEDGLGVLDRSRRSRRPPRLSVLGSWAS